MKGKRLTFFLFLLGSALLISAVGYFVFMRYSIGQNAKNAKDTVQTLYSLMPSITVGTPNEKANVTMSSIEVNGESFVGIIEIPAYESSLPICGAWNRDKISRFPCRYLGSVYDGTLVIGGSDNDGQFDFIGQISNEDTVYIIDTLGVRYTYSVTSIRRIDDASTENICKEKNIKYNSGKELFQ